MTQFFNLESYYSRLKTRYLGRPCIYLEKVDSTIDVATKQEPNTIVIAKEQLKGRGQGTNVWQSPTGCAMGSVRFACRKISPLGSRICFLQHIMVLAAAKTLEQLNDQKLGKSRIKLKWPNDIIYMEPTSSTGCKIGGVLVQTAERNEDYDITLSFGLNVFNSKPTTCISDIIGPAQTISIDMIVAEMMNNLEQYTHELDDENFQILKCEYTNRCIQMNRLIEDERNGKVKVKEVSDDGYLIGERCADHRLCTVTKIIDQQMVINQ